MKIFLVLVSCVVLGPWYVHAQTIAQDTVTFERARVVLIESSETREIPGTKTPAVYQTLRAELLEGPRAGEVHTISNDYLALAVGDTFYVRRTVDAATGRETFVVSEPYRVPALLWLGLLFVACAVGLGGKQGLRGLLALGVSLACIVYLLLPGILAGYSPVLVALGVSSLVVILGSYITHGINRSTTAAVLGMLATITVTGVLAHGAIAAARLSGFASEESTYLHFNTQGSIDFVGLLLAGLLIGLLGVLYDAAISQAVAVDELAGAAGHLTKTELFRRGFRIGREHIGALVNTLAIAYVGVSLPLLLLFNSLGGQPPLLAINQEIFATELVRIFVGSIGVILAVPLTTAIAVYMLHGRPTGKAHGHTHHAQP